MTPIPHSDSDTIHPTIHSRAARLWKKIIITIILVNIEITIIYTIMSLNLEQHLLNMFGTEFIEHV